MDKIDVYWTQKKPGIALYVPHGRGLPDLTDVADWNLDRTVYASEVPEDLARRVATDGHAFGEVDDE
jgi:hypothetical protein